MFKQPYQVMSISVVSGTRDRIQEEAFRIGLNASQLLRNMIDHHFVSGQVLTFGCNVVVSGQLASGCVSLVVPVSGWQLLSGGIRV